MSSARLYDVDFAVTSSSRHFEGALEIYAVGCFDVDELPAYRNRMAFLHAMQCGYTSLEAALKHMLAILDEDAPAARESYSLDLVRRESRPIPGFASGDRLGGAGGSNRRSTAFPTGDVARLR